MNHQKGLPEHFQPTIPRTLWGALLGLCATRDLDLKPPTSTKSFKTQLHVWRSAGLARQSNQSTGTTSAKGQEIEQALKFVFSPETLSSFVTNMIHTPKDVQLLLKHSTLLSLAIRGAARAWDNLAFFKSLTAMYSRFRRIDARYGLELERALYSTTLYQACYSMRPRILKAVLRRWHELGEPDIRRSLLFAGLKSLSSGILLLLKDGRDSRRLRELRAVLLDDQNQAILARLSSRAWPEEEIYCLFLKMRVLGLLDETIISDFWEELRGSLKPHDWQRFEKFRPSPKVRWPAEMDYLLTAVRVAFSSGAPDLGFKILSEANQLVNLKHFIGQKLWKSMIEAGQDKIPDSLEMIPQRYKELMIAEIERWESSLGIVWEDVPQRRYVTSEGADAEDPASWSEDALDVPSHSDMGAQGLGAAPPLNEVCIRRLKAAAQAVTMGASDAELKALTDLLSAYEGRYQLLPSFGRGVQNRIELALFYSPYPMSSSIPSATPMAKRPLTPSEEPHLTPTLAPLKVTTPPDLSLLTVFRAKGIDVRPHLFPLRLVQLGSLRWRARASRPKKPNYQRWVESGYVVAWCRRHEKFFIVDALKSKCHDRTPDLAVRLHRRTPFKHSLIEADLEPWDTEEKRISFDPKLVIRPDEDVVGVVDGVTPLKEWGWEEVAGLDPWSHAWSEGTEHLPQENQN